MFVLLRHGSALPITAAHRLGNPLYSLCVIPYSSSRCKIFAHTYINYIRRIGYLHTVKAFTLVNGYFSALRQSYP